MIGSSRTASLHVEIDSDTKGVSSGVDSASGKFAKLGSAAKLGGLAVAGGLVIASKAAVDMIGKASDLNETISKSQVIFGDHAKEMDAWARNAAKTLGLSESAALGAATSFGDMFSQLGFTGDQAAKQSKDVVQLATDLGSFNNLDTSDVLDRLSGAFRGEYDSLQAVLPNISAARVQQEALNETHKESVTDLTAAEKATATLALVHRDASRASGDFARTSGGLANQQKILSAQLENTQASIGKKLLPVAVILVKFLNDKVIPAAQDASKWFGDHLGPVISDVGTFIDKKVIPAAKRFQEWFGEKILPTLKKEGIKTLESIRGSFQDLGDKIQENRPQLEELFHAFQDLSEWIAKHVIPVVADLYRNYFKSLFKGIEIGIDTIGKLVDAFQKLKGWIDDVKDAAASIHFPSAPSWLGKIPGLSAPSYDPRTPAAFGTAAWEGTVLSDLLGSGGLLLSAPQLITVDNSVSVTVDGSGIVDERAIAAKLIPVLERHAIRVGQSLAFSGVPA